MSQYGAYGFAQNGSALPRHPRPLLHGHRDRDVDPNRRVRVLLQSVRGSASFTGAVRAGRRRLVVAQDLLRAPPRCGGAAALRARQAAGHLQRAARDRPRRHGHAARPRGQRARERRLPRRHGLQPRCVLGRRRHQRALARHLPARRGAGRVAAVVADRGAEGAGRGGAHLRDRDDEAGRRLRPLPRHALAGLRRRRGRGGLDQPGDRRDARRGRDLQRRRRSSPTSSPPRAGAPRTSRTRRWATSRGRG